MSGTAVTEQPTDRYDITALLTRIYGIREGFYAILLYRNFHIFRREVVTISEYNVHCTLCRNSMGNE